jgi:EAL domain-containing protein (putative c-di-GMP-specific phosphodiesterase class I)/ActR/RegA family two-component response regulator
LYFRDGGASVNDEMNGNRLLMIDDEPAFGRLIKRIAEASGFAVEVTEKPQDFQRLAQHWRPSLVIMDLQIPGTDGIELLRVLTAHHCDAHVIIASGLDAKTLDAAHRLGLERGLKMAGTLSKPARATAVRELLVRLKMTAGVLSPADLGDAIAGNQLFLEYQPLLDCSSGEIGGVEALVRWKHPVRGRIPPDEFIPLAEGSELIDELTDWVVGTALTQAAAWRSEGIELGLSINISARNLSAIDFPDRLAQRAHRAGISPAAVIFELTETAAMRDAVQMMDVLTRLRVKGFRLSIDDFGTGHSSLLQLQRMPFSELKIDRSFVMQMLRDKEARVIVEIVIDLARKLGLYTVAEGVEDEPTMRMLLALGCNALQGYYLSRPLHPDRLPDFVREHRTRASQWARRPDPVGRPRRQRAEAPGQAAPPEAPAIAEYATGR